MTANSPDSIKIAKLTPNIGAKVTGVNLAERLDKATFDALKAALLEHLVVHLPEQDLPPGAQINFTERFGAVEPHPLGSRKGHPEFENLLVLENNPNRRGARNDFWHSDISCAPTPPALTVLHAITVPQGKGDTLICNMYRAFEELPEDVKTKVDGLTAEHSGEAIHRRNEAADTDGAKSIDVPPPEVHPVVRRHPETGRRALFTNRFFTTRFTGMTEEESAPLLEMIEARATEPDNVYRHHWQPGDLLIWDNRCTMHYAVYDYDPSEPRRMHRTTAAGDRPAA
ncbi:MAG: TauD/TfdA family dioxygenase [Hyphomicrobiaceae bacterium]|nr:TauD/TfdA family dioxygenase [Hyphomicrobiaceae bacterium]